MSVLTEHSFTAVGLGPEFDAATANDGMYTDAIGKKGGGTYTYKACPTSSTAGCSNDARVVF